MQVHPGKDGIVALLGDRDAAREKATGYMNEQCPGGFDVVEEGEAVVGETSNSQSQGTQTIFGPAVNTQTSTRQQTEWRIRYQCKGAAPAAAPGPGGAPAPAASGAQGKIHEIIIRY